MIKELTEKLIQGEDLEAGEVALAMEEIMLAKATPLQSAAFLTALRAKKETPTEIAAAAKVMRKFLTPVRCDKEIIMDTCGTGGDCKGIFNVSTVAALVVASIGITVAKHGNRSVSSNCGSADLLEGLGVNINLSVPLLEQCLREVGIAFLFAPNLHPLMKKMAPIRRELGFRTIFNILGPLSNPASATHQLLGVFDVKLLKTFAQVLKQLNIRHALVVHGRDGLDEITTTTLTDAYEVRGKNIRRLTINPEALGIKKSRLSDLKCADFKENIQAAEEVLSGAAGPKRDIVVLNAAAAIYLADKAKSLKAAAAIAQEAIDSGRAQDKLNKLREFSRRSV
ncbi:MAG: anthranilate phosphoribosyltransferase [Candidatus Omnitrophota bacterium]